MEIFLLVFRASQWFAEQYILFFFKEKSTSLECVLAEYEKWKSMSGKQECISNTQAGRFCMQPHITESVERVQMQHLGASPWPETLLLSQASSQFIQETKEGLEMKVQTCCHPVTAGGSCQTTPKCCIALYWARSLLKWANRLWCGSTGSALHCHREGQVIPGSSMERHREGWRMDGCPAWWLEKLLPWPHTHNILPSIASGRGNAEADMGWGGKSYISLRKGKNQALTPASSCASWSSVLNTHGV